MTSCGLNGDPLCTQGEYPAAIACNITNGKMPHIQFTKKVEGIPCVTHSGEERYITGIQNQTLIGYKYFYFDGKKRFTLKARSTQEGKILISDGKKTLAELEILHVEEWTEVSTVIETYGVVPLLLVYQGDGMMELLSFCFSDVE